MYEIMRDSFAVLGIWFSISILIGFMWALARRERR